MAKQTLVRTIDDLDGSIIDESESTVAFSLGGNAYEIDLSSQNLDKLRTALEPFINAARRVNNRPGNRAPGRRATSSSSTKDRADIREWARKNGYELGERGRVPSEIVDAYDSAH